VSVAQEKQISQTFLNVQNDWFKEHYWSVVSRWWCKCVCILCIFSFFLFFFLIFFFIFFIFIFYF